MNDLHCACASLVVFVDDDVLFLVSLITTHGHVGLPTSTAQRGGLRGVGARGRSVGLRSGDLFSNQACSQEASYSLGMMSSGRTTFRLALSQAPEHVDGEEYAEILRPSGFGTHVLALAKPPSMSRGRVCDTREEKVGLNT
jgi:hypothetical protein